MDRYSLPESREYFRFRNEESKKSINMVGIGGTSSFSDQNTALTQTCFPCILRTYTMVLIIDTIKDACAIKRISILLSGTGGGHISRIILCIFIRVSWLIFLRSYYSSPKRPSDRILKRREIFVVSLKSGNTLQG